MYNKKNTGNCIRSAREAKGYTQDYLAYKLNMSQNAYSKIELGKSQLTVDRLIHLSEIMGFNVLEMIKRMEAAI